MLQKDYGPKCSVEEITGRESQGVVDLSSLYLSEIVVVICGYELCSMDPMAN
jgi:hypothetical protein